MAFSTIVRTGCGPDPKSTVVGIKFAWRYKADQDLDLNAQFDLHKNHIKHHIMPYTNSVTGDRL